MSRESQAMLLRSLSISERWRFWGYVEGVERSLGTVATLDIDWKDPAKLAEHLRSGCYVEILKRMFWLD